MLKSIIAECIKFDASQITWVMLWRPRLNFGPSATIWSVSILIQRYLHLGLHSESHMSVSPKGATPADLGPSKIKQIEQIRSGNITKNYGLCLKNYY